MTQPVVEITVRIGDQEPRAFENASEESPLRVFEMAGAYIREATIERKKQLAKERADLEERERQARAYKGKEISATPDPARGTAKGQR